MSDRIDDRVRQVPFRSHGSFFREMSYGHVIATGSAFGFLACVVAVGASFPDPGFGYYGAALLLALCVLPCMALAFALFPGPRVKFGEIPQGSPKHRYILSLASRRDRFVWFSSILTGCLVWAWLEVTLGRDLFFLSAMIVNLSAR
jgi:hypothetical protein